MERSKSYPLLSLSRKYGVPYEDVLLFSDSLDHREHLKTSRAIAAYFKLQHHALVVAVGKEIREVHAETFGQQEMRL